MKPGVSQNIVLHASPAAIYSVSVAKEIMAFIDETQQLSRNVYLKPAVSQNIALHASPAVINSAFLFSRQKSAEIPSQHF